MIGLAFFLSKYPDHIRADFQHYYGLNLDDMGGAYSVMHAAALASQLPHDSRTHIAIDPQNAWGLSECVMAMIEYNTHLTWYASTEDARRNRNRPVPLLGGGETRRKTTQGIALDQEDYMEILSKPRKEVKAKEWQQN